MSKTTIRYEVRVSVKREGGLTLGALRQLITQAGVVGMCEDARIVDGALNPNPVSYIAIECPES